MLLYFYVYNIFLFHFDILVNSFLHFKDWVHLCFYRAKGLMLLCKLFMAKKRARRTIYRAGARLQINPTTWCLLNRELMSVVSIASSLRAHMMGIDASSISRTTMFVPADYPVFVLWSKKYFLHICFFRSLCWHFYFLSQDRSKDWKAEYMFRVLFHEDNKVPFEDLPEEIQCLSPTSTLSTQGEELLLMLTRLPAEWFDDTQYVVRLGYVLDNVSFL